MSSIRFLFFVLSLTCVSRAQGWEVYGNDTINKTDNEGLRQGRWIFFGKHKPNTCYQPDQKVEEGVFTDNRKTDIWVEYHCNGKMKNRITFVNGRPDGYAQMFHENGKISEEGNWKNSRWVGNYKLYYDNGQVQHEFVFSNSGRREGQQKYFYENGQLAIEGNFVNGKESGTITEYHENGDIKAQKIYNDGNVDVASIKEYQPKKALPKRKEDTGSGVRISPDEQPNEAEKKVKGPLVLNGQYTLYNKNKQITKDGVFKDNRFMDGKAYLYNSDGILTRVAVYKDGVYIGDAQIEK